MARRRREFVCQSCGAVQPKWSGRCPACGQWDSLVERPVSDSVGDAGVQAPEAVPLSAVAVQQRSRLVSGIGEFDRLLGGGFVPGSGVLLAGDPGIGKSTLMLQVAARLQAAGSSAVYISSEESLEQVYLRARRLGVAGTDLKVCSLSNLPQILHLLRQARPALAVVDSVQMVYRPDLSAAAGSLAQLKHCATEILLTCREVGTACVLVGHVTKAGAIAGPRIIEHLVDVVLHFEGDRYQPLRLVRTVKNRYGSTEELGVFEMTDSGLRPVENPSAMFLPASDAGKVGSVVTAAAEGSRILLLEVQALCVQGVLGAARRRVTGPDPARVAMLLAVLERHAGLRLADQDVFVNVVGGVKVPEPACDLPVLLAVASALLDRPIRPVLVAFGEVGLAGEVRAVQRCKARIAEAARLGFSTIMLPHTSEAADGQGVRLVRVCSIVEALTAAGLL